MKTTPKTKECSVTIAFAELGRLERDRAEVDATKRALRAGLRRQASELEHLRGRLEAERPKALDRLRRERARRERANSRLAARLRAEAAAAHDERLALLRAELEAKRLRLAAVEVADEVPKPGRRLLEWSVPAAAVVLVGLLGVTLFDEGEAVAQTPAVERVEPVIVAEPEPEPEPELEVEPELAPEPAPEPELAPAPEPEPKKSTTRKKSSTSKKSSSSKPEPKPEPKPAIKKNSNPLKLGDFDGDPLG